MQNHLLECLQRFREGFDGQSNFDMIDGFKKSFLCVRIMLIGIDNPTILSVIDEIVK